MTSFILDLRNCSAKYLPLKQNWRVFVLRTLVQGAKSWLPGKLYRHRSPSNGSTIHTYGSLHLDLNLSLRRDFRWVFVIADVNVAIIGSDFLAPFGFLDFRNNRLIEDTTGLTASYLFASLMQPSINLSHKDSLEIPELIRPAATPHSATLHRDDAWTTSQLPTSSFSTRVTQNRQTWIGSYATRRFCTPLWEPMVISSTHGP